MNDRHKPIHYKMLQYADLLKYAEKHSIKIDKMFFVKHGFKSEESDWLIENMEEIKMQNKKIQVDKNNEEIKKLNKQIEQLETELNSVTKTQCLKGNNALKFKKTKTEWIITEPRKTNNNIESGLSKRYVTKKVLDDLWDIIKSQVTIDEPKTNYRNIITQIKKNNNIKISLDSFNGGRNRARYYFPLYYYPMKILEHLQYIKYGGKGQITVLNFNKSKVV